MTERIGGPPQAPAARPGGRRWALVAAGLVIAVVVVLGGLWAGITAARNDVSGAMPASWSSPSPAVVIPLSEEAACYALVPLIGDALEDVDAVMAKPDGSTVDWQRLDRTIAGLQAAAASAPSDMRSDVESHLAPLVQLRGLREGTSTGQSLALGGYRDAALRLLGRCEQYAHS